MKSNGNELKRPTNWVAPVLLTMTAAMFLAGCVVSSIYPFYQSKDLVFESGLLGTWQAAGKTNSDDESWIFEKQGERSYKLIIADGDKKPAFDTHLFKLEGRLFLDCLSRERPDHAAPVHYLMQVEAFAPQLKLRLLNYDWLKKQVAANPKLLRHVWVPKRSGEQGEGDLLLTADTVELQDFIRKHLKHSEAWDDTAAMERR